MNETATAFFAKGESKSMSKHLSLLLAFGALLVAACAPLAEREPEQHLPEVVQKSERVILVEGNPDDPVKLEVTLYTPPGPSPFPLAVLNHGSLLENHTISF
ncbi:hypothetical protein [Cupriavidus taiwanensis]|uniref:Uncharacterized protein n=1 Tax=Cupriavidus taiwanensis TaxID=164546 RepID=A0A375JFG2_9BURK|nr:hypothetical protein [Cupriavidus taiwanensis]SPS02336.1 exported hypothetical protein [Cupriavidus taiwanensis]